MAFKISTIIEGLTQERIPSFFANLSRELGIQLNVSRLKTGVVANRVLAIDDVGRFVVTSGTQLRNGNMATISNVGKRIGTCSKVVPSGINPNQREFMVNLATQLKECGHNMNIDRMKTGRVGDNLFAYDDLGRYINTTTVERLRNGQHGTVSTYGKFESYSSKVLNNPFNFG